MKGTAKINYRYAVEPKGPVETVEANHELIARMEKKMQTKLAKIWGEEVE